jgi:putative transposase
MGQSLSKVYIHIVFSTKNQKPFIKEEFREGLQAYIVGILSGLGSFTHGLYANPEHIHILATLSWILTQAVLVQKVKTSSAKWMKNSGVKDFGWQDGYAVFSVSASKVDVVKKYILNQEEHHKKVDFKEELKRFFKEYRIDFDERYVWD